MANIVGSHSMKKLVQCSYGHLANVSLRKNVNFSSNASVVVNKSGKRLTLPFTIKHMV